MRKVIRASVLVLALSMPAFAGDIPFNVTSTPPATATQQGEIPNNATGDIPNGVTGDIPYNVAASSVLVNLLVALVY